MNDANGHALPTDIVGHKTFDDGHGGFRHEPLTRAEADAILARVDELKAKRAADMPDVPAAIRALTDAYRRLEELGWGNATYCPKDGSEFEVIEPGSSGIHRCIYRGEWPDGKWWILHDGDMSPSRPVLWRRVGSCAHMFKRPDCENCGGRDVPPLDFKALVPRGDSNG